MSYSVFYCLIIRHAATCLLKNTSHGKGWSQITSRRLSLTKIMQGECNGKTGKLSFSRLDTAEPQLSFDKDKKRAAQRQMNDNVFSESGMNRTSPKYATKRESTDTKPRGLRDRK